MLPRSYLVTVCKRAGTWLWHGHNHPAPCIDNNPGRAGFRANLARVSALDPTHLLRHPGERHWRESKDMPLREKVVPRQPQNSGQALLLAQNSRWLSAENCSRFEHDLETPRRAGTHRKPRDW